MQARNDSGAPFLAPFVVFQEVVAAFRYIIDRGQKMSREANEALLARFEEYLVLTQLSPSTVVNYLADLRAVVRWGDDQAGPDFLLVTLTPDTIRAYRAHLLEEKACAAATVNRRLQTLRKFCAFAVQMGQMTVSPTEGIDLVQDGDGDSTPAALTSEQIEELLRAPSRGQPSLARRDTAILMLLLHTGLRVNELIELRLDDVQFDYPGVHLTVGVPPRRGKNGSHSETRQIPLEGEARQALCDYLSVRPQLEGEDHLFLSREGRPLSGRSVQRTVSILARSAGLDGVSPQVLRRTYADHLPAVDPCGG